jgi:hypothetical protein
VNLDENSFVKWMPMGKLVLKDVLSGYSCVFMVLWGFLLY